MARLSLVAALAALAMLGAWAAPNTRTVTLGARLPYGWPKTLLTYPLTFAPGEAGAVWVTDAAGVPVPSQLIDVVTDGPAIRSATLCIVADLPVGATKTLTIHWTAPGAPHPPMPTETMPVVRTERGMRVSTGTVAVEIPALGERDAAAPTGPVLRMGTAGKLYGASAWKVAKPLKAWRVVRVATGPLLTIHRVEYDFADGARYTVTIRAADGMPYIDVIEDGAGVGADMAQYWELDLTDLQATEKYNHNDRGTPRWNLLDKDLHPATGEWRFRLSPFYPKDNDFRHQMVGLRNAEDALGFSVRYTEQWKSDRYPLWGDDRYNGAIFLTRDGKTTVRFPVANGRQWIALTGYPVARGDRPLLDNTIWHEILDLNKMKDQVFAWNEPVGGGHKPVFEPSADPRSGPRNAAMGFGTGGNWARIGFTQTGQEKNPSGSDRGLKGEIRTLDRSLAAGSLQGDALAQTLAAAAHTAYLHAGDSYFPDEHMLAGHPNFMGDAKTPPGVFAAVLPNHPDAKLWRDHSERAMELLLRYHTRPTVNTWQARGGRWTENPSCYLRHCLAAWSDCFAAMRYHGDGRNIFARPQAVELGDYMVNLLSAPYNGARLMPQQGAHSGDITTPGEPYRVLALALKDYAPQTAEHLVWAAKIGAKGDEGNIAGVLGTKEALAQLGDGTPPLLESAKFTGYGIVMRHGVDTPGEVYINLQQIDAGPNYRWGRAGDGGNGCLYYYADGKRFTAHGGEDVGDASKTDTEATTSFGVWRDKSSGISRFKAAGQREPDRRDREGMFYSVGLRELTEPFYPFKVAQRARLLANPEYAGPDYRARTAILVGGDYLVLHDEITNPEAEGRFSWSTADVDAFPDIQQLRPGGVLTEATTPGNPAKKQPGYKRRYYTGKGDFLTFVSHKPGFAAKAQPWGVEVTYDGGRDLIFQALSPVTYKDARVEFQGTSAVVRLPANGKPQVALFGEGRLVVDGMAFSTWGDAGLSATITGDLQAEGEALAQAGGALTVVGSERRKIPVFLDGAEVADAQAKIAPGRHIWNKGGAPIPPRPAGLMYTSNGNNTYTVTWSPVPGATVYRLEEWRNGGWGQVLGPVTQPKRVFEAKDPGKTLVRVIARNGDRESEPSAPFAVYTSTEPCRAPDGLKVDLYAQPKPLLSWGQTQGAARYVLERRLRGTDAWTKVYEGTTAAYADPDLPSRAQYDAPGGDTLPVYEYRVGAYNGNGGAMNLLVRSSDPKDYLNIDPMPGERFRRQIETFETYGDAYDPWREIYNSILPPYPM